MLRPLLFCIFLATPTAAVAEPSYADCINLTRLHLESAKVTSATYDLPTVGVDATHRPPPGASYWPFCRVQITDAPTPDSDIRIELWLPVSNWNGRFLAHGNGGFAGEFHANLMSSSLAQGYATASTDTGHSGPTPEFALGHPEKIKDFGWRGIHDMTTLSKSIINAFYKRPAAHAYFAGCSDGGREALMEAQRFPADYDGILAGAPAYNWSSLVSGSTVLVTRQNVTASTSLPSAKLPAIAAAVNRACDAQDGVADGVLNDPRTCHPDLASLLCQGADSTACLTPGQLETLTMYYSPRLDSEGKVILEGHSPGAEAAEGGPAQWLFGPTPGAPTAMLFFSAGYFSNFVYQQPDWKLASFSLDRDWHAAQQRTAAALDATSPDLRPFTTRGGKLILFHGWNDPAIPALSTIDYYNQLTAAIGAQSGADSTRLYMIPGMLHCGGGPGATEFGASGHTRGDPRHDILTALERWVEAGTAPATLIATRPASSPPVTRPLCPYPAIAKYTGKDPNDAASFTCAAPAP